MGGVESRPVGGSGSDDDEDEGENWMQADKYAEWECANDMDYNGTVIQVKHVEMPLNAEERTRITSAVLNASGGIGERVFGGSAFTHEALVFDILCTNGRRTKFTAELTFSGVLKRWGHHKVISRVKAQKHINLPMTEVLKRIETYKPYNLVMHNCKHYASSKYELF